MNPNKLLSVLEQNTAVVWYLRVCIRGHYDVHTEGGDELINKSSLLDSAVPIPPTLALQAAATGPPAYNDTIVRRYFGAKEKLPIPDRVPL